MRYGPFVENEVVLVACGDAREQMDALVEEAGYLG
jgi:hypothetical protein